MIRSFKDQACDKGRMLGLVLLAVLGCTNQYEFSRAPESLLKVEGASIQINHGAEFTRTLAVSISLQAAQVEAMRIGNLADCSDGEWVDFAKEVPWTLSASNKQVQVYVQFRSVDGLVTGCIDDSIVHDDVPPLAKWIRGPQAWSADVQPDFGLQASDRGSGVAGVQCLFDSVAGYQSCNLDFSVQTKEDGLRSVQARVFDRAGNYVELAYKWRRDTIRPVVRLVQTPFTQTKEAAAEFGFEADDVGSGVAGYECRMDSGSSFHACQSPLYASSLSHGQHIFTVRARDGVGNLSGEASFSWLVDLIPPTTRIVAGPSAMTKSKSVTFEMSAVDNGSGVDSILCRMDQETFKSCSRQEVVAVVSEGRHTWYAQAVDKVGNKGGEVAHQWLADYTPPRLNWISVPQSGEQSQPSSVEYMVEDDLSGLDRVVCLLDNVATPCSPGVVFRLENLVTGRHHLRVVATDRAGNSSEIEHSWQVYPNTRLVSEYWDMVNYGSVDLLFVVDSSSSMSAERAEMGKRFGNLLDQLAGIDWQIAMTTTDVANDNSRSQGRLMSFRNFGVPILTSQMDLELASQAFRETIADAKGGSSNERGIYATSLALERRQNESVAQQFFRAQANLEVIVVTDSDNVGNDLRDQPSHLRDYVSQIFGANKSFSFHSIIVLPGDRVCVNDGESYGNKYYELSKLTGGVVGSVCAKDYSSIALQIGQGIRDRHRQRRLQCAPYDRDGDGQPDFRLTLNPNVDPPPIFKVQNDIVYFEQFLPLGHHLAEYVCLKP